MVFDRIQVLALAFSVFIFCFIFGLVKNRRVREEYSLLWFAMSFLLLYLSIDRFAIDRLGSLMGIAYPPSVLTLMTTGFTFLLLIHLTVVITQLSEQNKILIQDMGLVQLPPTQKGGDILIIVPAYNEESNIGRVIEDLDSLRLPLDILVVNDGSSDRTSQCARSSGRARVIDLSKNLGVGGAVQTGFRYAEKNGYDIAVQFDGDGQHFAAEISKLLQPLRTCGVSMVIGSRFLDKQAGYRSTFLRRIGISLFQWVNSLLIGQRITDNTSGFRAYDQRAISFLSRHYPVDYPEPEAVILLGKSGFGIAEVSVCMGERQGGVSSIAGLTGAYYMIKVLLAILMAAFRKPAGLSSYRRG